MIKIKSWKTSETLFSCNVRTISKALEIAVHSGVDLSFADLSNLTIVGANLSCASFYKVKFDNSSTLVDVDMSGSNLNGASFVAAKISGCNFDYVSLTKAKFDNARLSDVSMNHIW